MLRDRVLLAILPFVPLAVLRPSSVLVVDEWLTDRPFGYGFLIALMAAAASWKTSKNLHDRGKSVAAPALAALLFVCLCWYAAVSVSAETVHIAASVVLGGIAVWVAFGLETAIRQGPVVGLLMLAVPVWEPLTGMLQHLSIASVQPILYVFGIPVAFDGAFVLIPEGTFEIASGCSGISFLISALALSLFVCVLDGFGPTKTIAVVGTFAALAVVSNWVRIALIVALGHYTSMQNPIVLDHGWLGWILFAGFAVPMVVYLRRLPLAPNEPMLESKQVEIHAGAKRVPRQGTFRNRLVGAGLAMLPVLLSAGVVATSSSRSSPTQDRAFQWPLALGVMHLEPTSTYLPTAGMEHRELEQTVLAATYRKDGELPVVISVASRAHPFRGDPMPDGRAMIPDDRVSAPQRSSGMVAATSGTETANATTIQWRDAYGKRWVTSYNYLVGRRAISSRIMAKLSLALRLRNLEEFAGAVAATRSCADSCDAETRENYLSLNEFQQRLESP